MWISERWMLDGGNPLIARVRVATVAVKFGEARTRRARRFFAVARDVYGELKACAKCSWHVLFISIEIRDDCELVNCFQLIVFFFFYFRYRSDAIQWLLVSI